MKRSLIVSLLVLIVVLVPVACNKTEDAATVTTQAIEPETTAAADAGTTHVSKPETAPTASAPMIAATGTQAPVNGSVVRVDFDNAICHFLDATPPRAGIFRDTGHHTPTLTIMQPTAVAATDKLSVAAIKTAFGNTVGASCDTESCTVSPIDKLTLRIIDTARGPILPPFSFGPDFDLVVPHLKTVAKVPNMNAKVKDKVANGDFTAFFDFNGGTLSALPYCAVLKLKHKDNSITSHPVADRVTLTGSTAMPAKLEITRQISSTTFSTTYLEFKQSSKLVWLVVDNVPTDATKYHFGLHVKAGDGTGTADFPKVEKAPVCQLGVTAACGNTQWP